MWFAVSPSCGRHGRLLASRYVDDLIHGRDVSMSRVMFLTHSRRCSRCQAARLRAGVAAAYISHGKGVS